MDAVTRFHRASSACLKLSEQLLKECAPAGYICKVNGIIGDLHELAVEYDRYQNCDDIFESIERTIEENR